jgi:hypothetical protein
MSQAALPNIDLLASVHWIRYSFFIAHIVYPKNVSSSYIFRNILLQTYIYSEELVSQKPAP